MTEDERKALLAKLARLHARVVRARADQAELNAAYVEGYKAGLTLAEMARAAKTDDQCVRVVVRRAGL